MTHSEYVYKLIQHYRNDLDRQIGIAVLCIARMLAEWCDSKYGEVPENWLSKEDA